MGAWFVLMIILLNYLSCGMNHHPQRGYCAKEPTLAQKASLNRLSDLAAEFCLEKEEDGIIGRVPDAHWESRLKGLKTTYKGENCEIAQTITARQIEPGLPPEGFGGSIDIMKVVDDALKESLSCPLKILKKAEELDGPMPRAKVHCDKLEWQEVAKLLVRRGIASLIGPDEVFRVGGKMLLNGCFGVKKGKRLESGEEVLRFIVNLIPSNWAQHPIVGDVKSLTGVAQWQVLTLPKGFDILVSAEDMVAAFYLFHLPQSWWPLFTLANPVPLVKIQQHNMHKYQQQLYICISIQPLPDAELCASLGSSKQLVFAHTCFS